MVPIGSLFCRKHCSGSFQITKTNHLIINLFGSNVFAVSEIFQLNQSIVFTVSQRDHIKTSPSQHFTLSLISLQAYLIKLNGDASCNTVSV